MSKRYDQAYFDRWYRHPRHRVKSDDTLVRKAVVKMPGLSHIDALNRTDNWTKLLDLLVREEMENDKRTANRQAEHRTGNAANLKYLLD